MTPPRQTVCLCMIVKDEAHVIRRCLASVRPLIDRWLIVDTGSTDGTQAIIREAMADLPGELHERPWRDFAHNRSEALALARPHGTYSLIIDADDEFENAQNFQMPPLEADSCTVDIHYAGTTYQRPQLIRNSIEWRYRGVLHEFLEGPGAQTSGHLPIIMKINHEGRRSTDPSTYAKDAAILENALKTEADPFLISRYTFYLAQSYRDCGNREAALAAYLRRAEQGYWAEEVFYSLYQAGKLMEALGRPPDEIISIYKRATESSPSRAEAAHAASRFCRGLSRFAEGCAIARPFLGLAAPASGLFIETWIYDYGLADEFAVNAYWVGEYRNCLEACLRTLEGGKLPAAHQPRIVANMRFALNNMPKSPEPFAALESPVASEVAVANADVAVPSRLNLGSGKDFRADYLNLDVNEAWSPDIVVDLSRARIDNSAEPAVLPSSRFGTIVLKPNMFEEIIANDVLEHVPDLVTFMTNCLALLRPNGVFKISVPYDLSFGAWQDPTHVRTFNERSWLYYTDWFWYLGWDQSRFIVEKLEHVPSPLGLTLRRQDLTDQEINRTPRAIDGMTVWLRKIALSDADRATFERWRPKRRNRAEGKIDPAFAGPWSEHKDRYCIWVATVDDYSHYQAFHEVADALHRAFSVLGGSAPIVSEPNESHVPIVFGSHLLLGHKKLESLPAETVLFNLEQIGSGSPFTNEAYLDLLRRFPVLDYSLANTSALKAAAVARVRHMAVRPMPSTMPLLPRDDTARDIDVLFYGSMNERRAEVLNQIRSSGLRVVELFDVYGCARDDLISRAKIVVNIHFYPTAIFESVRIAHLLASGKCVVSEGDALDPDCMDLAAGLVLCPYDMIAEHCVALARDSAQRRAVEDAASRIATSRSQVTILREMFGIA